MTGGNKGIGFGIAKELCKKFPGTVILTGMCISFNLRTCMQASACYFPSDLKFPSQFYPEKCKLKNYAHVIGLPQGPTTTPLRGIVKFIKQSFKTIPRVWGLTYFPGCPRGRPLRQVNDVHYIYLVCTCRCYCGIMLHVKGELGTGKRPKLDYINNLSLKHGAKIHTQCNYTGEI